MSSYMSADARRIVVRLAGEGVVLTDTFQLELDVLRFFPNHILGVIDGIKINVEKANSQGWPYFAKPVRSMLGKRRGALREDCPIVEDEDRAREAYRVVSRTLILADMPRSELVALLGATSALSWVSEGLAQAVRACKAQGHRSVFYLNGVLRREAAEQTGRVRELRTRMTASDPFSPGENFEPVDAAEAARLRLEWDDKQVDITLAREMRRL